MTASSVGGLVAAFLASLCCIGPAVLAALGVGAGATGFLAGTAGLLKGLLPYRPFFIGLTACLVGASLYLASRPARVACGPGGTCASAGGRPWRPGILWVIATIAAALVLAPYWVGLLTG